MPSTEGFPLPLQAGYSAAVDLGDALFRCSAGPGPHWLGLLVAIAGSLFDLKPLLSACTISSWVALAVLGAGIPLAFSFLERDGRDLPHRLAAAWRRQGG